MGDPIFYTKLAKYYDILHSYIDYKKEAGFILEIINKYVSPGQNNFLDMCCGTGEHIKYLRKNNFKITGADLSKEMIEIARQKNPRTDFVQANMKIFTSKRKFDIILCYFNSILYNKTSADLSETLSNFFSLLLDGGILIFDGVDKSIGLNPQQAIFGKAGYIFRTRWDHREDNGKEWIEVDMEFEIRESSKLQKVKDVHKLGAFNLDEIKNIAESSGFQVDILEPNKVPLENLNPDSWRGVFVCRKI